MFESLHWLIEAIKLLKSIPPDSIGVDPTALAALAAITEALSVQYDVLAPEANALLKSAGRSDLDPLPTMAELRQRAAGLITQGSKGT